VLLGALVAEALLADFAKLLHGALQLVSLDFFAQPMRLVNIDQHLARVVPAVAPRVFYRPQSAGCSLFVVVMLMASFLRDEGASTPSWL